ncbi:acyl-CoA dehydrogenase family protein [Acidocella sp. KAb 2-4]|uniref:acyl-CoA dehydrogenase family protein n=1 Tax=Acidocella sp. KAb 2-4 TaxID=2885158 RepID=UPI001D0604CD|nr:acyl-CoA dehydrogenase [Acidocella sp. KAb 2-4]MCB5945656.1 acyl-CoA dehydrogenase family protein [Acidocella sp. KAb 2-4]
MSFAETEAQVMLADMTGRLLAAENEFEARRQRLAGSTPQRLALWPQLAEQGILGAAFGEEVGGFGGTMRDLAVLMEVIGARLVVEPVLANAICGRILAAAGDLDQLAALIAGERILALATTEGFDPFALPATHAVAEGEGFRLTGTKQAVRHADLAHGYVVSATLNGAAACFLVEAGSEGVTSEPFRLIDASSAATLTFQNTPARYLGGAAVLEDALLWAQLGLAAEAVGIFGALNAATFAYLGTRKQFGVPLASFQALQHRAADMFAAAEEARALAARAIRAVDQHSPARFAFVSAVKALTDSAGHRIGHEAVQMHGGMGVSDELNVSHYMRRLAAIRAEFGSADLHRTRFATISEDTPHVA